MNPWLPRDCNSYVQALQEELERRLQTRHSTTELLARSCFTTLPGLEGCSDQGCRKTSPPRALYARMEVDGGCIWSERGRGTLVCGVAVAEGCVQCGARLSIAALPVSCWTGESTDSSACSGSYHGAQSVQLQASIRHPAGLASVPVPTHLARLKPCPKANPGYYVTHVCDVLFRGKHYLTDHDRR